MKKLIEEFNGLLRDVNPKCLGGIQDENSAWHRDLSQHQRETFVFREIKKYIDIEFRFFGTTKSYIDGLTVLKLKDAIKKMEDNIQKVGKATTMNSLQIGKFYKLLEEVSLFKTAIISQGSVIYVEKNGSGWNNKSSIIMVDGGVKMYKSSSQYGGGWDTHPLSSTPTRIHFDPYSIASNKIKEYSRIPKNFKKLIEEFKDAK